MKKRINKNLMGIATLAIVLTLGLTFAIYFQLTQKQIMEDLRTHVHILNSSDYVLKYLEDNYDPKEDKLRITVVDADGRVVYESDADAAQMENHIARPEIRDAMNKGEGKAVRRSNTIGTVTFYYAERQENGNVIRVAREFGYFANVFSHLVPEIIAVFAGIFILCLCLGHFLTKRFIEPVEMLAENADRAENLKTYPEIQPFIRTIHQQHTAIKKNAKMREEFTANVSHELKTPLTSISGYAELIETGIASGEDTIRFAGEIHKNSQRLLVLINDILRLSQLDSIESELEKEPVDLYEVAQNCRDMLEMQAENNHVSVRVEGEHVILPANRQMIEELIYNLCDNAIRYNNYGGKVDVSVKKTAEGVLLCVEDTGIGISEKDRDRIFERFYRVDKSRSKQTGGTGLGLAIVKHIAVLHDARIQVDSKPGAGTKIKILFEESDENV